MHYNVGYFITYVIYTFLKILIIMLIEYLTNSKNTKTKYGQSQVHLNFKINFNRAINIYSYKGILIFFFLNSSIRYVYLRN